MNKRNITKIMVERIGWLPSQVQDGRGNEVIRPIEMFTVNGEMAPVPWFRQGKMEYNGKYVIAVEYDRPVAPEDNTTF